MSWLPRHTLARAGEAARLWQDGTTINTGRFVAPCGSQDSVGRNALSDHCSRNLSDEIAVRIIDIQRERTAVGVTLFAKNKRFGQITRSLKISAYIVEPNSVSKLESPRRRLLPRSRFLPGRRRVDRGPFVVGPDRARPKRQQRGAESRSHGEPPCVVGSRICRRSSAIADRPRPLGSSRCATPSPAPHR